MDNNKMDAILGYTGLVGSTIREGLNPSSTKYFNSKNFNEIRGQKFNTVYCACIPGVKWKANNNPERDLRVINYILDDIRKLSCEKFVLISTIDVHDVSNQVQTEEVEHPASHPYGVNRLHVEKQLFEIFGKKLFIVRLPALFGIGLKKNIIFDLLNNNCLNKINGNSCFQWYPLKLLVRDIERFLNLSTSELDFLKNTINLYPSPMETMDIIRKLFPEHIKNVSYSKRYIYNQSTSHTGILNYQGDAAKKYIFSMICDYVSMMKYYSKPNRMAISNMAWDPMYDDHAIFLMKRYNISKVELLPTKYGTWDDVLKDHSIFSYKYLKNDIDIYSFQSVLSGVKGTFCDNSSVIIEHLDKVVKLCNKVGGKVIVMGSPSTRKRKMTENISYSEECIIDALSTVQKENPKVKVCLEANSSSYGCEVGTKIGPCMKMAEKGNFYVNFDTGNYSMELDNMSTWKKEVIGHCQISSAFLRTIHVDEYNSMLDPSSSVFNCMNDIKNDRNKMISLECKVGDINYLGSTIHDFVVFMSKLNI